MNLAVAALLAAVATKPEAPAPADSEGERRARRRWLARRSHPRSTAPGLGRAARSATDIELVFLLAGPPREPKEKLAAAPCDAQKSVEEAGRNAQLYRWRFESPERLELLGTGLPEGSLDTVDLDGDGNEDLLLQRKGGIDRITLGDEGGVSVAPLAQDEMFPDVHGGPRIAWDPDAAGDGKLRVPLLGGFRTYGPGSSGAWTLISELAVPQRVDAGPELFRIRSPSIEAIGRAGDGRLVFATESEPLGKRRLRTLLLDPDGPAERRVVESWALFPEPERVVDRDFALLRGAPVLIVTTTTADKLSILGEKALRIYPLGGDRTRAGDPPLFAAMTGINLWQEARPTIIDLDGDGRDDLVLAYWKGLKNSIVAFEVYRGTENGSFGKARSTSFEVDDGKRGVLEFGRDLDGDGRPDAMLRAGTRPVGFCRGAGKPRAGEAGRNAPVAQDPARRRARGRRTDGALHGVGRIRRSPRAGRAGDAPSRRCRWRRPSGGRLRRGYRKRFRPRHGGLRPGISLTGPKGVAILPRFSQGVR